MPMAPLEVAPIIVWGSGHGQRAQQGKGLETVACLLCLRNCQEAGDTGREWGCDPAVVKESIHEGSSRPAFLKVFF